MIGWSIVLFCFVVSVSCYRALAQSKALPNCAKDEGIRHSLTDPNSACLDGSKPVFYHRKGTSSNNKWLVFFEGGGWCYTFQDCYERSLTYLGSTKRHDDCLTSWAFQDHLSNNPEINPLMHDWNMVFVRYCDGSSYAGNTQATHAGKTLLFRGMVNRDETIKAVLALGMKDATDIVISGCSAGGLAVYLGIDQMAKIIRASNPHAKVRGMPISGFFVDYDGVEKNSMSDHGSLEYPGKSYRNAMRSIFSFMNISAGVNADCMRHFAVEKQHNCMVAKHVGKFVQTPLFSIQSKYDQWELEHILQPTASYDTINQFGALVQKDMLATFSHGNHSQHGVFIESCYNHCFFCSVPNENTWSGPHVIGHASPQRSSHVAAAFEKWYRQSGREDKSTRKGGNNVVVLQDAQYPCHDCCACPPR